MSALGGFWSWRGQSSAAACHDIVAAQRAYGPHDTELWSASDIALGRALHRLLPEDEFDRQPLIGAGGRLTVVADIRLDNREEMLERLGGSADGSQLSDADILLRGFERWGEAVLDLIIGDYAFAIWDGDERRLILARDPTGQRPLHFHRGGDFFAFSSLARGLHALPEIPRRPDPEHLTNFIALLPPLGSTSFYLGVERVRPGHVVTVTRTRLQSRRYWYPQPVHQGFRRFEEWRDAFRAELDRAVRVRLRGSGSRLGAHLSGGWDSGAVAATAARLSASSRGEVIAFTSVPHPEAAAETGSHRFGDEGPIAAATASLYPNMRHILVHGEGKSPIENLDELVQLYDRPVATLCNHVWMGEIRRRLRHAEVAVLLTGELGNWNISAGPHSILSELIRQRRWGRWAREAFAIGRTGGARWRGVAINSVRPWVPERHVDGLRRFSRGAVFQEASAIHPRLRSEITRRRERLASSAKGYAGDAVDALLRYDFGNFRKGALAGWGVDERDPTSDRRLTEFCLSLPIEMLLRNGERRPLARAALSDRLPPLVLAERRKGYQAADWHEGMTRNLPAIRDLVEEIGANDLATSLIDIDSLRSWVHRWPTGGWERPQVEARYRTALLVALSAGHFIVSTSR